MFEVFHGIIPESSKTGGGTEKALSLSAQGLDSRLRHFLTSELKRPEAAATRPDRLSEQAEVLLRIFLKEGFQARSNCNARVVSLVWLEVAGGSPSLVSACSPVKTTASSRSALFRRGSTRGDYCTFTLLHLQTTSPLCSLLLKMSAPCICGHPAVLRLQNCTQSIIPGQGGQPPLSLAERPMGLQESRVGLSLVPWPSLLSQHPPIAMQFPYQGAT